MTLKIEDAVENFLDMPIESQTAFIAGVRHRKFYERPVVKKKVAKKAKKAAIKDVTKAKSLIKSLSPEEKLKLIAQLKGG